MTGEVQTMAPTLDSVLEQYPAAGRDKLIPILQEAQELQGYISREAVISIGRHLGLPTSKIYGVATFYNQFRFEPIGRYHIQVCRGTACHVKGSAKILSAITGDLRIQPGRTSRDGMFSLEVVACIGACGLAPVISVNGEFHARLSPEDIPGLLKSYREQAAGGDAQ